jgi:hypothetical protein
MLMSDDDAKKYKDLALWLQGTFPDLPRRKPEVWKAFVKQTWNNGFDFENNGRPDVVPGNDPTPEGNDKVWPGIDGGANWMSHSYSPLTKLMYVFAREEHRLYTKNEIQHPTTDPAVVAAAQIANTGTTGRVVRGGYDDCVVIGLNCGRRVARFAPEESYGKAIAIDPSTGTIKWEHKVVSPPWGGMMSTAATSCSAALWRA